MIFFARKLPIIKKYRNITIQGANYRKVKQKREEIIKIFWDKKSA